MRSVAFVSLGCAKNLVDTEVMIAKLGEAGWRFGGRGRPRRYGRHQYVRVHRSGEGRIDAGNPRARLAQAPRPAADRRRLPGAALRRAAAEPDSRDRRRRRHRRLRGHRRAARRRRGRPPSGAPRFRSRARARFSAATRHDAARDGVPQRSPKAAIIRARSASFRRCAARSAAAAPSRSAPKRARSSAAAPKS